MFLQATHRTWLYSNKTEPCGTRPYRSSKTEVNSTEARNLSGTLAKEVARPAATDTSREPTAHGHRKQSPGRGPTVAMTTRMVGAQRSGRTVSIAIIISICIFIDFPKDGSKPIYAQINGWRHLS